jgi:integrase
MSEVRVKIGKRVVDAIGPGDGERFIWDSELSGFGVRVRPSGAASYIVLYRHGSGRSAPRRRVTLASVGTITPDEARRLARVTLADAAKGLDPAAVKAKRRKEETIGDLCDRYLKEHVAAHNKASTAEFAERQVDVHIRPEFGKTKIGDLRRSDVKRWHSLVGAKRGHYAANRALAVLRKILSLAVADWELVPVNVASGIPMFPETKRAAFGTDADLKAVGAYLAEAEVDGRASSAFCGAVRLLALSGMRLGEVLGLERSSIDFQGGVIRLEDAKAGARSVPMPARVRDLLAGIPKTGRTVRFLFGAGLNGERPISLGEFRTGWRHMRAATGLSSLRPHDLRHGAATFGAQAGANAFLLRDYLGHKTLAMSGRYVERTAEPIKDLAETVASRVGEALEGKLSAAVVPIRRR